MWRPAIIASMVALVAATAAIAPGEDYYSRVYLTNWNNGHRNASTPTFLDPAAQDDGAVWLNQGSGPVLNLQDFNVRIDVKRPDTGAWTTLVTAILNDGTAVHDVNLASNSTWGTGDTDPTHDGNNPGTVTPYYYSGYFGRMGTLGYPVDIPGSKQATVLTDADFHIWGWTGNYDTYDHALAASQAGAPYAYVGEISFTQTRFDFGPVDTSQYGFTNMPALVLKRAPAAEPSTLSLAGFGAALLMLRHRRRLFSFTNCFKEKAT
jgi:hypothetical protein